MCPPVLRNSDNSRLKLPELSVLFGAGLLSDSSSGTFWSLQATIIALAATGVDTTVVGILGAGTQVAHAYDANAVHTFTRRGPPSLYCAPGLRPWLNATRATPGVVSLHGIWQHTNSVISRWAAARNIPRLVSAHGGFSPLALSFSKAKKWAARKWFVNELLDQATCFHALNEAELGHIREFGLKQPVCVVPNGVLVPADGGPRDLELLGTLPPSQVKVCLYLGRLHPIKNLESLILAWRSISLRFPEWILVIAGDGDPAYQAQLQRLASRGAEHAPRFLGTIEGDLKDFWLRRATLLVQPSYSEGMPMAPLEAMARGVPALVTQHCQLDDVESTGAGMICGTSVESLEAALLYILSLPPLILGEMGRNARALVSERYSLTTIGRQLVDVYRWMRGEGDKPGFCFTE